MGKKESKKFFTRGFFITWIVVFILPYAIQYLGSIGELLGFDPLALVFDAWISAMFAVPFVFILFYLFPVNILISFVIAVLLKNAHDRSETLQAVTKKIVDIFKKKTTLLILGVVVAALILALIYNVILLQINASERTDVTCKYMIPTDAKSSCYLQLARTSGDVSYCERATRHAGCWKIVAQEVTLDISICESHGGHVGSCIRDVMESAGGVIDKGLNGGKYCNETNYSALCIEPISDVTSDGNQTLTIHLVVNSETERSVTIDSNLCSGNDGPLKPVECTTPVLNPHHTLRQGRNELELQYQTSELVQKLDAGVPIGIKFIRLTMNDSTYTGIHDALYPATS